MNTPFAVNRLLAAATLFVSVRAVSGLADTARPDAPDSVSALLEAKGYMEAAHCLFSSLPESNRTSMADLDARAVRYIERVYPACRAITAEAVEDRVAVSMRDAFFTDVSALVKSLPPDVPLPPRYPADFVPPGGSNPPPYGTISLIDDDPMAWAQPAVWGGKPKNPAFAGWAIQKNLVTLAKDCTALVRSDFSLDDAEVTGEVRIDGGECVFVILRSDVVVKFHPGEAKASGGNLNVKIGYDNLRTSTIFNKTPEIYEGRWYPFQITLSGQNLRIVFDGAEVMDNVVARDARLGGARLARAGYFGFGANSGSGAFRNVHIRALTAAGQEALPRLKALMPYHPCATINFLDNTNLLVSLVHTTIEGYRPANHPILDGVLRMEGGPYSQLSRNDIASDHFRATGKLKFLTGGSVWLRANSSLVFGIRSTADDAPFAVKHSTANFNYVDEENEGDRPQPDRVYAWELEYHEPVGILRFDGKTVAISLASPDRDRSKTGPNQFGISSYNTRAEFSDVVVQKLAPGGIPADSLAKQALRYYDKGLASIVGTLEKLKAGSRPGNTAAVSILEGAGPAVAASVGEVILVAEKFRDARDWPGYLALLEANAQRFDEKTDARKEAEAAWKKARTEFDNATAAAEIGEIGPDNVIHMGNRLGARFADADGKHVWLFIPDKMELIRFAPSEGTAVRKLPFKFDPRNIVVRNDYFLCTAGTDSDAGGDDGKAAADASGKGSAETTGNAPRSEIRKIDLATGGILASTNFPTDGTVLSMVAHPKRSRTYVCVNENVKPSFIDLSLYKIYELDESSLAMTNTGAIGMFIVPDPFGRYLYAGFNVPWRPGTDMDPGFLRVVMRNGQIDHMVRYRITAQGLILDRQFPAPGIGGRSIVTDPAGKTVCYVADFSAGDDKDKRPRPFGIRALKTTNPASTAGVYDAGNRPLILTFNPTINEAYILTGNQIRRHDTDTFEFKGTIAPPSTVAKSRILDLLPAPDGGSLISSLAGKSAAVCIHRLRTDRKPPPSTVAVDTAEQMIRDGKTANAKSLLLATVQSLLFSSSGEKAARILLEMEGSPITQADVSPWQIPAPNVADDGEYLAMEKLALPSPGPGDTETADDAGERFVELMSFEHLCDEFPYSWFWLYRQAACDFSNSARLKIAAAARLVEEGRLDSASTLIQEALVMTGRKGELSSRAWQVMDRIYAKKGDVKRCAAALSEALALDPRDPFILARIGSLYGKMDCPRKARNSKLLSWHIFPSQPDLAKELADAGVLDAAPPPKMDVAAIFKKTMSAVVLVSHDGGNGTGFVLGRNGLLLTNHHVVDGAENLTVKIKDADGAELSFAARVLASDAVRDVALLSVRGNFPDVTPLEMVNSDRVEPGEKVIAIGNPGLGSRVLMRTITEGIVSGRNRVMGGKAFFQISAAVNPGNSGGPLLNWQGQVVGMVTSKANLENVGFAVPSTELLNFIEEQKER